MRTITTHATLLAGFAAAIGWGGYTLTDYANRPGSQGAIPHDLTFLDFVNSSPLQGTLILSVHPHCPCTVATVRELSRLRSRFSRPVTIISYIYCPTTEADAWTNSSITETLRRIPGAALVIDRGGASMHELGTRTSGQVLYYDQSGKLVFSGGITSSRGHEGMCPAATDLLQRINGDEDSYVRWPVFGCAVFSSEATAR